MPVTICHKTEKEQNKTSYYRTKSCRQKKRTRKKLEKTQKVKAEVDSIIYYIVFLLL